jgi:carbon-monoxide dehydrogenase large subunit
VEYQREQGSKPRYVGVPVPRREDRELLTGQAQTVADLRLPDTLELAFTRSPLAHAEIRQVSTERARQCRGVAGAWSGSELPDVPRMPVPPDSQEAFTGIERHALANGRVRFAGEPVAVVAAETRALAEDAAEQVVVGFAPLPPVLDPEQTDAVELFPGRSNMINEREFGEPVDDVFAQAPVVVQANYRQQLLIPTSIEARAVLVRPEPDGGVTVWVSHQAQHQLRTALALSFGLDPELIRVVVPMAGGAFGAKSQPYPEYALAMHLALTLGRPVRWVEDRAEALRCATRGRGQTQRVRLAAEPDGRLLAYELSIDADIGAYPHTGDMIPAMTGAMSTGAYATPRVHTLARTVLTTTPPTAAYRGAGRPEAAFAIERTMDQLARRLGLDPAELRRRNFIHDFPYTTPTGRTYDSGQYGRALDQALSVVDYTGLREEQRCRREHGGRPLGIGIASYVERSGGPPDSDEYGSVEVEPDGSVLARSGSTCTGQAHPTVFPQVVASALDIDLERVRLVQNDTREVPYGFASFGSRSLQVGGGALWRAARRLVEEARHRFAELYAAEPVVVGYQGGTLSFADHTVTLAELVQKTGPLLIEERFAPPQAFPFGTYVAAVEVDPELGDIDILRLVAVDDYGVVVNPLVVDGQSYGSIAQGLGQALYEQAGYTPEGLPTALTLLDYLLPTASDLPEMELSETETPNPNVGFGAKGAGEAGCIGVPPAIVNAVCDALDIDHIDMPLTPEAVFRHCRPAGMAG